MKIKNFILMVSMVLMSVATIFAQAPQGFTYQAVVRNSSGKLISNAAVGVKITILQGTSTGNEVYSDEFRPQTNANGLFSIIIGNGVNSLDIIDWAQGPYFLKSEIDPDGGNNYTISTVQQLLSVPYALHAQTAGSVAGGINYDSISNRPINISYFTNDAGYLTSYTETQILSISNDTIFLTGGSFVVLPAGFSGNYNDLTNKPNLFSGNYNDLTNKPTIPNKVSDLTNDAGYLTSYTESQVLSIGHDTLFLTGGSYVVLPAGFSGNYNDLSNKPNLFSGNYNDLTNKPTIPNKVSDLTNDAGYLTSYTESQVLSIGHDTLFLTGGSYVVLPAGFSGNYNDLSNKPNLFSGNYNDLTNKPTIPNKVSDLTNDASYLTSYTESQVLSIGHDTLFLTGGSYVVLPAGFSGNYNDLTNKPNLFSGSYNDLTNKPTIPTVPTNVSSFTNDAGYLTSYTESQVLSIGHDTLFLTGGSFVVLPAGFSGNYNDLTNKPTIPTIPTNVSAFTNDAGYLTSYTESQVLSIGHDTLFLTGGSYVVLPAGFSGNYNDLSNKPNLFSGNYNDLTNKPTIPTVPTNVSSFTNDAGYLTSYTESQVLSIGHDTLFLTGGSFVVLPNETQTLADVAQNNNAINSQVKNLYNPTDSMDAVNLRTVMNILSDKISTLTDKYDSIINELNSTIDSLRQKIDTISQQNTDTTSSGGLSNAQFSVSATQKVLFSPGNLQWSATNGGNTATTHTVTGGTAAGTWRFAPNQWDIIGTNNSYMSSTYTGWIDLFGWGTSGYNQKYPYMTSTDDDDYVTGKIDIAGTNYDWGVYNAIYNPQTYMTDAPGTWRTLEHDEWWYLIGNRTTTSGIRYAKAKVKGVNGLIIVPDNWNTSIYTLDSTNTESATYTSNIISDIDWARLETYGCVFLPAAGGRTGSSVFAGVSISGYYWSSSTHYINGESCYMDFNISYISIVENADDRYFGKSVRLVRSAQ